MKPFVLGILNIIVLAFVQTSVVYSQDTVLDDSLDYYISQVKKYKNLDSSQLNIYKRKILNLAKSLRSEKKLFYTYSALGSIYKEEGVYNKALNYYFKSLEYSKSSDNQVDVALNYDNLARIYLNIGEIGLMFESINKSLSINNELGNEYGINKTKQILITYYRNVGNYSEVLRIAFISLKYFISTNDSLQIANTYNSIGVTYKLLENYEKSLAYYNLSDEYFNAKGDKRGKSRILNNKGTVFLNLKKYQDALENFKKSLEIEKEIGSADNISTRYNNIGLTYAYLGNYESSIYYLRLCLNRHKKAGNLLELANSYESLAQFYDLKKDADSLEYYLLKSYKLCEQLNIKRLKSLVAFRLSELYQSRNDIKRAFNYLSVYKTVDDSLYHSKSFRQITEEEYRYLHSKDFELQKIEKSNTFQRFIIVIGFLVILILVFWVLFLKQRVKVKTAEMVKKDLEEKIEIQKDELLIQGKELMSKTLQLGNDTSEVRYAIQQLKKLKSEFGIQGRHKIQQLIQDLEHNQNKDIWSEFELRFSKVNKNFYGILLSLYPSLTLSERRLAALIFLNFSTKEIAIITKQTPRSVLVAKSRLRKKMNLPATKDISNYLNELLPM